MNKFSTKALVQGNNMTKKCKLPKTDIQNLNLN